MSPPVVLSKQHARCSADLRLLAARSAIEAREEGAEVEGSSACRQSVAAVANRQSASIMRAVVAPMSRHALSERSPSCVRRKHRVLCLHSFRTSGAILKQQLFLFSNLGTLSSAESRPQQISFFPFANGAGRGGFRALGNGFAVRHSANFLHPGTVLSDYCDLDYIDAPHRCSPADDDKLDPLITQVFKGPYHEWFNVDSRWSREGAAVEYNYLEESLRAVADAVERRGPYDGLIGFSQARVS